MKSKSIKFQNRFVTRIFPRLKSTSTQNSILLTLNPFGITSYVTILRRQSRIFSEREKIHKSLPIHEWLGTHFWSFWCLLTGNTDVKGSIKKCSKYYFWTNEKKYCERFHDKVIRTFENRLKLDGWIFRKRWIAQKETLKFPMKCHKSCW